MRLTLRTLLAYLDGILPADARADLAKQVDGNATAEGLIKRIHRAVARPEIPAPKLDGRGLADDANSVAEFLDNSLPADRLAAFEKICLESDLHLAEVAACHQLLAEIARDDAAAKPLDAASHERLLQLFHHRAAVEAAAAERDEARENAVAVRAAVEQARHTPQIDAVVTAGRGVASPARRPWFAWASAAVALLVLLLAGGVLTWKVVGDARRVAARRPEPPAAVAEPAVANQPADDAAEEPAAQDATPEAVADAPPPAMPAAEQAPPPATATVATDEPPASAAGARESDDDPFAPAATQPQTATAPPAPPMTAEVIAPADALPPAQQPRVPQGDALAIAAAPAAAMPGGGAPAAAPPAPSTDVADDASPAVGTVGPGGVLLHRVLRAGRQTWVYFPAGEPLMEREDLVAPPGSDAEIDLGGIGVKLLRGTQATLSIDPDGTQRITVVIGRIIARAMTAEKRLGITAARLHGVVTAGLTEPVAAGVELERRPGDDPAVDPARVVATLMSTTGGLGWRQLPMASPADPSAATLLGGIAEEGLLEARSALVWDSKRPERAVTERRASLGWAGGPEPIDPLTRRAADALKTALEQARPLFDSLHDMAIGHRAENRALAAATLALLGEYDELVILLVADRPGERLEASQWLALEAATVPLALARGANSAAKLRATFLDRGPRGKGEALYAMACGFTDADLAAGADAALVEALDDPDLVMRRYAAKNLFEIVQPAASDRIRYRPDGLEEMRRQGVAWWRAQLEKTAIRRGAGG
jgi:cytoskeletal protein RodZ